MLNGQTVMNPPGQRRNHSYIFRFAALVACLTLQYCCLTACCQAFVTSADKPALATGSKGASAIDFSRLIGPKECPGAPGFADPYVFKEGGKWYITSTYTKNRPMYIAATDDFKKIEYYAMKLDFNQSYLRKYFKKPGLVARDIWGFVPYKHVDGRWHAYASIHIGGYKTFICHFASKPAAAWPITEWRLDKVLVGYPRMSSYESKVYSDQSGLYLVYVARLSDGNNHIMVQKLLDPGTIDIKFKPRAILSPEGLRSEDRNQPGSMQIVEGPNISHVVTPNGSKYVLLYSVGDFANKNYKLAAAYSDTLIPPNGGQYQKPKVSDDFDVWSNHTTSNEVVYTLQTQFPNWYNYVGDMLKGPGLGNLVEYKGDYYMIFHALDEDKRWGRWVWICPVTIDFTKSMDLWLSPRL